VPRAVDFGDDSRAAADIVVDVDAIRENFPNEATIARMKLPEAPGGLQSVREPEKGDWLRRRSTWL